MKRGDTTTIVIDKDVRQQLDNLLIVLHGVQIKTPNDKIRYLLHEYEAFSQKKDI